MSRIGNKAIALPAGVTVTVNEGNNVTVKGAKGELSAKFHSALTIEVSATEVLVKRPDDSKENKMDTSHCLQRDVHKNLKSMYPVSRILGTYYCPGLFLPLLP